MTINNEQFLMHKLGDEKSIGGVIHVWTDFGWMELKSIEFSNYLHQKYDSEPELSTTEMSSEELSRERQGY